MKKAADEIHERIRKRRESTGLSIAEFAAELGVNEHTYFNFESGKTKLFGSKCLTKMAEYFNSSEEDILFGYDELGMLREEAMNEKAKEREKQIVDDYEARLKNKDITIKEQAGQIAEQAETIENLRRELDRANQRIDSLIAGLGISRETGKQEEK